jgi:hypothetical protein
LSITSNFASTKSFDIAIFVALSDGAALELAIADAAELVGGALVWTGSMVDVDSALLIDKVDDDSTLELADVLVEDATAALAVVVASCLELVETAAAALELSW